MRANYNLKKFFANQRADTIWRDKFIADLLAEHLDKPYEVDDVVCANSKATGKAVRMDVATWTVYNGALPEGYTLKHIDGDYTNCRLSNLKKEKIKK